MWRSGKRRFPWEILQVFLQTPQRPRRILPKAENVLANRGSLLPQAMWLRKEIGIDQSQEVRELVLVPVVGRGRKQEHVIGLRGEPRDEIVPLSRSDFRFAAVSP